MMFFRLRAALLLMASTLWFSAQADEFNLAELKRAYAANNAEALPTVSFMRGGIPLFLLYPDGRLLVGNRQSKRPGFVQLSAKEYAFALSQLAPNDDFWRLSGKYNLAPNLSDQPEHVLTLRLPGKPAKEVSVYGALDAPFPATLPPHAFTVVRNILPQLTPTELQPWDPGYVEINWSDYSYAPDQSVAWPEGWPGLSSPLARSGGPDDLIKYYLIFPSAKVAELDEFLASRPERGAILLDGWKGSANYRWPLPNEKKWSSWTR